MDVEGVDVVTNVAVLARFGHALSDETRTRILLELKPPLGIRPTSLKHWL